MVTGDFPPGNDYFGTRMWPMFAGNIVTEPYNESPFNPLPIKETPKKSKLIPVIKTPMWTIYAQRNEAGGLTYWSDDIPGGYVILDTAIHDFNMIKSIMSINPYIEEHFEVLLSNAGEDSTSESST